MKTDLLTELNEERRHRRAVIRAVDVETGREWLVREGAVPAGDPLAEEYAARFRSGRSGMAMVDGGGMIFLNVHVPPPRIVVAGAVHISQALVPMAKVTGFDIMIVDPRTAFATPERFPDVDLLAEWPEDVIDRLALDRYTAVVAVTHDPKIDDLPLTTALTAGCFYVGALGSRKTHAKRVERLIGTGLAAERVARIHAPIGLDIGAASPAEIALAILAEIVASLRQRPDEARGAKA